jgi:hypothetical protein
MLRKAGRIGTRQRVNKPELMQRVTVLNEMSESAISEV